MSNDLVKLNWNLVKNANNNAFTHSEALRKAATIGEWMEDPNVQNAALGGIAGMTFGGVKGMLGKKDEDESRAAKILKNTLGFGAVGAGMGYGAGPVSAALGGPEDPLATLKEQGMGLYDAAKDKLLPGNDMGWEPEPGSLEAIEAANEAATRKRDESNDTLLTDTSHGPRVMPQGAPEYDPSVEEDGEAIRLQEAIDNGTVVEDPPGSGNWVQGGRSSGNDMGWDPESGSLEAIGNQEEADSRQRAKRAGYWSELAGMTLNPINMGLHGNTLGGLAALGTDTRNVDEQAEADESLLGNLLIPGKASYNAAKRVGHSIRGPEIKGERAKLERQREEKRDGDGDGMINDGTPEEREKAGAAFGHRLAYQAFKQAQNGTQNMPAGLSAADQQEYAMDPTGFGGKSHADQQEEAMYQPGDNTRSHLGPPNPQQMLENQGYKNVASFSGTANSPRGTTAGPPPVGTLHGAPPPVGTLHGAPGRGTTAGPPPRGTGGRGSHNPANQQFNQSGSPYGPNYNPNAAPPITKSTPAPANAPYRSPKTPSAPSSNKSYTPKVNKPKQAGFWSEYGQVLNPLNVIGTPLGAAAALATPTRNRQEQAEADQSTWSNALVPGKGAYNAAKRTGHSIRGPEITEARDRRKKKRREADERAGDDERARREIDKDDAESRERDRRDKDDEKNGAARIGAYFAKLAVETAKWDKKQSKGRKKKRVKIRKGRAVIESDKS